ncbi:MAG: hypothetical protein PVG40_07205, partial [Desulfobacterales bacterium]
MRHSAKKILRLILPIAVILMSSNVLAQDPTNVEQVPESKQDVSKSTPDLANIIPKAAQLSGDLAMLENSVTGILDISELEEKYTGIEENLKNPAATLQQIKDSKNIKLNKLVEIRKVIE